MPAPFDLPPSQVDPDGAVTFAYVHETPELALRFEGVDHVEAAQALPMLVTRVHDSEHVMQMRSHVVGRRTCRMVAIFPPEHEGAPGSDASCNRFDIATIRNRDRGAAATSPAPR